MQALMYAFNVHPERKTQKTMSHYTGKDYQLDQNKPVPD